MRIRDPTKLLDPIGILQAVQRPQARNDDSTLRDRRLERHLRHKFEKSRRYAFQHTHNYIYICFLINHGPYRSNPSLSTQTGSPTRYLFGSTLPRIAVYITPDDAPSRSFTNLSLYSECRPAHIRVAGPVSAAGVGAITATRHVRIARNGVLIVRATRCDCAGVVALRRVAGSPALINRSMKMFRLGRGGDGGISIGREGSPRRRRMVSPRVRACAISTGCC